ncbi:MAG: hypothetical protein NVSMB56_17460 [Pyrinomonadaceae bacterium]
MRAKEMAGTAARRAYFCYLFKLSVVDNPLSNITDASRGLSFFWMLNLREDAINASEAPDLSVPTQNISRAQTSVQTRTEARNVTLYLLVGAAGIGLMFWFLQYRTDAVIDVDGYYHIKWSRLLWEGIRSGHFPPAFPWLPLTELNPREYVDHHLFFHILLIPFTWFGDLRVGAKAAAAFFGSLALLSCYWLVIRYKLRYPLTWLVALMACSSTFLYRMSMTRAQTVSIVLMVAGIYLLFERKYRWLVPLAFIYALTYSLFISLIAAAFIWAFASLWSEGRWDKKAIWDTAKAPLYTIAGSIAGFVINPYFPNNIKLFTAHVIMKATPFEMPIPVGIEWDPFDTRYLGGRCIIAFAAMIAGYIAFNFRETDRKQAARAMFLLIFSTMLMIITFRSRRWVEYWPPFAILFAAFTLEPILERFFAQRDDGANQLPAELLELQPLLDRSEHPDVLAERKRREKYGFFAACAFVVILMLPLAFNVNEMAKMIGDEETPFAYQKGTEWIHANVPKGERVFNTDWDDFGKLFYYDSDHAYIMGLDPTYLHDQNKALYDIYVKITLGEVDDPAPIIREKFGCNYVFTRNPSKNDFYQVAMDSGWFETVFKDEHCSVLHILDEQRPVEKKDDSANGNDDENDSSGDDEGDDSPDDGEDF